MSGSGQAREPTLILGVVESAPEVRDQFEIGASAALQSQEFDDFVLVEVRPFHNAIHQARRSRVYRGRCGRCAYLAVRSEVKT